MTDLEWSTDWEYKIAKVPDLRALYREGWRVTGYDPRYLPSFGSVWVRRRLSAPAHDLPTKSVITLEISAPGKLD